MQTVRAAPGILPPICTVPHVFPRNGVAIGNPRPRESELVMASTDPIADGLTKIFNASQARHPTVEVRASRLLQQILELLKQEGFIRNYRAIGEIPSQRALRVYLKYMHKTPAITKLALFASRAVACPVR